MIKTFRHKGLQLFFEKGKKSGIKAAHASKLSRQLTRLHVAKNWEDMNIPSWGLQPLKDKLKDHYSISVNGNWRMTFKFEGEDVVLVDYQDYH